MADQQHSSARAAVSGAFSAPATPRVLLKPRADSVAIRPWGLPFFNNPKGRFRLTGGAGTGKTTAIMDFVATRILEGTPASEILVITASKEAAARIRTGIADRLAGAPEHEFATHANMVRSVHSLAFALLREQSGQDIRLITGAEQDGVIRDLLLGHLASGEVQAWPEEYREAVGFVGFARDLRDFLLRAAERGATPELLQELGQLEHRSMWTAAGTFLAEYEQVMSLGSPHNYSASELVSRVLEQPISDHGWRIVIAEDAQHFDPKSAELLEAIMAYAHTAIIAGDPAQAVFSFRGASPAWLRTAPVDTEVHLETQHRNPKILKLLCSSAAREKSAVANTLRRAHLIEGVPWREMAVIVRSSKGIPPFRRALLAAGVPVSIDATDMVLAEQPIVASMLLALKALDAPLPLPDLETLLLGPIGGADAITMRRLLRALRRVELAKGGQRRAMEILSDMLQGTYDPEYAELLGPRELAILDRVRAVLTAGEQAQGVEATLWAVWEATGLSDHLAAQSLRGGAAGSQADRDLDAMLSLFDAAGDWVERRPQGTIRGFVRHIEEQELPTGVRDRRVEAPDAVQVLTAHGAAGRQWQRVVLAGVQEGTWPALEGSDTAFGQAAFTDRVDKNIDPNVPTSRFKEQYDEEQRLFHLATSRASDALVLTAVEDPDAADGQPSHFLERIEAPTLQLAALSEDDPEASAHATSHRLLSVPALVAELRRVLAEEHAPERRKAQAARQLARLADAGVPGAHPGQWWGMDGATSSSPLHVDAVSPSKLEKALACPLNAQLGNLAGDTSAMSAGTIVHAYAEAVALGANRTEARALVEQAHEAMLEGPEWAKDATREAWAQMMTKLDTWLDKHQDGLEGVEIPVDVTLDNGVRIRGTIDRLQAEGDGVNIVDLKTGKQIPSAAKVEEMPQLVAYQLALRHGVLDGAKIRTATSGEQPLEVEGATLVYPKHSASKITREQARKTPEQLEAFAQLLPGVLKELRGPRLRATANPMCDHCQIKVLCPAQEEGAMIPND